jgi:GNAT superfamily N-acetyltransferase
MPIHTIHCHTPLTRSFRVEQVAGLFDLPLEAIESRLAHELTVELPGLDEDWTIGAIVGPSGSGKTTLARAMYGEALYEPAPWPANAAIIDCLGNGSIKEITRVLTAVGLGSVPTWLKPYRVLSTGERFRADLARAVLTVGEREASASRYGDDASPGPIAARPDRETYVSRSPDSRPLLVIDEFTSTLDRTVAQTASAALARLLRQGSGVGWVKPAAGADPRGLARGNAWVSASLDPPYTAPPRLVVLTCHTDILPWLAPDWVLDLRPSTLDLRPALTRGCLRRPSLRLAVRRVPQCLWPHFARHHYLAGGLAASATCYAAFWPAGVGRSEVRGERSDATALTSDLCSLTSRPIAFCAVVASLGWKKTKRITRLVVLPEFQGLGIAAKLAETVAAHEQAKGFRVTITASHPAILAHCTRSPNWKYLGTKKTGSTRQRLSGRQIACSAGRAVASFEYIGP